MGDGFFDRTELQARNDRCGLVGLAIIPDRQRGTIAKRGNVLLVVVVDYLVLWDELLERSERHHDSGRSFVNAIQRVS